MKFVPKKHYTFAELQVRWGCEQSDLVQAVIDHELIPSVHIYRGNYALKIFEYDYDADSDKNRLSVASILNGEDRATEWCDGFHYLIWPYRTGVSDCEFHYFSLLSTGHDEGDICLALASPIGIPYLLEHGVFMPKEVARVEAFGEGQSESKNTEKPLSNRERDTLLTIIAALCKDAGYDHAKAAKTAGLIQSTAAGMGLSIGETTIEGHLKKIPNALATRMK